MYGRTGGGARGGGGLDEAAEALIGLTGDAYMDAGQGPDAQVRDRECLMSAILSVVGVLGMYRLLTANSWVAKMPR
jgi:hypothetical protein